MTTLTGMNNTKNQNSNAGLYLPSIAKKFSNIYLTSSLSS